MTTPTQTSSSPEPAPFLGPDGQPIPAPEGALFDEEDAEFGQVVMASLWAFHDEFYAPIETASARG